MGLALLYFASRIFGGGGPTATASHILVKDPAKAEELLKDLEVRKGWFIVGVPLFVPTYLPTYLLLLPSPRPATVYRLLLTTSFPLSPAHSWRVLLIRVSKARSSRLGSPRLLSSIRPARPARAAALSEVLAGGRWCQPSTRPRLKAQLGRCKSYRRASARTLSSCTSAKSRARMVKRRSKRVIRLRALCPPLGGGRCDRVPHHTPRDATENGNVRLVVVLPRYLCLCLLYCVVFKFD